MLDSWYRSTTVQCIGCHHCALTVDHPWFQLWIPLQDFHLKRGSGSGQRPLADLEMAIGLVECLLRGTWPSPATVVDFGIDSPQHFHALQGAVYAEATAYDLDRVMGDGLAITRLVRGFSRERYRHVVFCTAYDSLDWDEQPDES